MADLNCSCCSNDRTVWIDDDTLPKGGFYSACPACSCDGCGGLLDGLFGCCRRCDAPEFSTARELGMVA